MTTRWRKTHIQSLVKFRQVHPAFTGDDVTLPETGNDAVLAIVRRSGTAGVMALINLSPEPVRGLRFNLSSRTGGDDVTFVLEGTLPAYGTKLIMHW